MPSTTNSLPAHHWTSGLWTCGYCGVAIGHLHEEGCAVLNATSEVAHVGPPITPGMLPRLVVKGDIVARYLSCLHCDEPFKAGEVIFENRAQSSGLHGKCILELAHMIPRELSTPAEVEAEFERRQSEIFDREP